MSTSYTPIATGGAGVNPLSSYQYKDVGVNIDMTPRVTLDGDIILDLTLDDSALGADKAVAGVTVPSFVQRKVTTRLRLRDGESNLLAGLLQRERRRTPFRDFPARFTCRSSSSCFSSNNNSQRADRNHHAAHAAHRPDAGAHRVGSAADLHRIAAEPRRRRTAAAHRASSRPSRRRQRRRRPPQPGAAPDAYRERRHRAVDARTRRDDCRAASGRTPVPGTVLVPPAAPTPPAPAPPEPAAAQPPRTAAAAARRRRSRRREPPITSPGIGSAQVVISPPGTDVPSGRRSVHRAALDDRTRRGFRR